jgi:hypothetical protein
MFTIQKIKIAAKQQKNVEFLLAVLDCHQMHPLHSAPLDQVSLIKLEAI